jgi:aspartyl-tRNA(Asn)/glutamyl-tRNA(Gln) amidotransferase subunit B
VTEKMARTILEEMFEKGVSPEAVIESKGLKPIQDSGALQKIVDEVFAKNPEAIAKIREGNKKPVDFLIGQVMKKTRGKADPAALTELIQKKLRS